MAKSNTASAPQRKPRILWANPFCLLDTSSGANMSVRAILRQLVAQGYEVAILGATIFDAPKGITKLKPLFEHNQLQPYAGKLVSIKDDTLTHHLFVTKNVFRDRMTAKEDGLWHGAYINLLDTFKPDLVWFYGGYAMEMQIPYEARLRGIPSAFYLVNGNYKAWRWCQDVDVIITDTMETAAYYQEHVSFKPVPVGKFIETEHFVAPTHTRERLLFINPSMVKGGTVVVQLALALEQQRPGTVIEVVESRGNWEQLVRKVTSELKQPRSTLSNVVITANTDDMRPIYGRARVLLAPSLWWESGARVLAEAMLNGIPALVSNHGGNPGMVEEGGILIDFPPECHQEPYDYLLNNDQIQAIVDRLLPLLDDDQAYQQMVENAYAVGQRKHHIDSSTKRLVQTFAPYLRRRAGDKNFYRLISQYHKHKLSPANHPGGGIPEDYSEAYFDIESLELLASSTHDELSPTVAKQPVPQHKPGVVGAEQSTVMPAYAPSASASVKEETIFDWQFKGQLVAVDNRAKLFQKGVIEKLLDTKAFAIVAFDPASEVKEHDKYADNEDLQLFRHALLGNGEGATLYTCLAPSLSSTLKPLPAEQMPMQYRQGAKVLAELPIQTIALDSIDGLPSLDWLILDERSDAISILEHGKQALKETLLIQARVAFQPTHERQPSLTELQYWASRNGFRFYRFNDASYQSLFPKESEAHEQLASELHSLDALFLPSHERMAQLDDNRKQKLVFLLHTVFDAHDMAYQVMSQVNELLAKNYLRFVEGELSAPISAPQELRQPVIKEEEGSVPAQKTVQKQATLAQHPTIRSFKQRAAAQEPLQPGEKGLFIDCGGYDSCSSIKFMMNNPEFDCVTFEPNPTLWSYYKDAPTFLIKKAAYIHDGEVKFTLDSLDEDGSSLIKNKRIDYTGRVQNKQFPTITAQCVDIARFIQDCEPHYDRIILKMDIEGAEYDILDRLIEKNLLGSIDKLYCEFHWHKCGISKKRHDAIVENVEKKMPVLDWDALDFSIHKRDKTLYDARKVIAAYIKECARKNKFVTEKTVPVFVAKYSIENVDEKKQEKSALKEASFYELQKNHDMLYEAARKELSVLLGELHGMEQSIRFWDIVLHYFLAYKFVRFYVSRWNHSLLNKAKNASVVLSRFPVGTTMQFGVETFDLVNNEAPFFDEYIKIPLAKKQNKNKKDMRYDDVLEEITSQNETKLQSCQGKYAIDLGVHNFPYWKHFWKEEQDAELIQLVLPPVAATEKLNVKFRQKIADLDKSYGRTYEFPGFWSSLALSLPKEFIEDFMFYHRAVSKCLGSAKPEFVASTLLSTMQARLLAATLVDKGVPLYLQQHGGGYAEFKSNINAAIEVRLSDKFFTWGWSGSSPKVLPNYPHRLIDMEKSYAQICEVKSDILIIAPHMPNVPDFFNGDENVFGSNIEEVMLDYIQSVAEKEKPNLVVRFRRQHGSSSKYEKNIIEMLPMNSRVDFQNRSILDAYAKAKEVIIVTPFSTSEWECAYLNIPYKVLIKPNEEFMEVPSFIPESYDE